jgi:hypothetical protein
MLTRKKRKAAKDPISAASSCKQVKLEKTEETEETEETEILIPRAVSWSELELCSYCTCQILRWSHNAGERDNPGCLSCRLIREALPMNSLWDAKIAMQTAPPRLQRDGDIVRTESHRYYGRLVGMFFSIMYWYTF